PLFPKLDVPRISRSDQQDSNIKLPQLEDGRSQKPGVDKARVKILQHGSSAPGQSTVGTWEFCSGCSETQRLKGTEPEATRRGCHMS
ncbi:mCG145504, partial [Mus musculus]